MLGIAMPHTLATMIQCFIKKMIMTVISIKNKIVINNNNNLRKVKKYIYIENSQQVLLILEVNHDEFPQYLLLSCFYYFSHREKGKNLIYPKEKPTKQQQ